MTTIKLESSDQRTLFVISPPPGAAALAPPLLSDWVQGEERHPAVPAECSHLCCLHSQTDFPQSSTEVKAQGWNTGWRQCAERSFWADRTGQEEKAQSQSPGVTHPSLHLLLPPLRDKRAGSEGTPHPPAQVFQGRPL